MQIIENATVYDAIIVESGEGAGWPKVLSEAGLNVVVVDGFPIVVPTP